MRKKKPYTLRPELTSIVRDLLTNSQERLICPTMVVGRSLQAHLTKTLGLKLLQPTFLISLVLEDLGLHHLGDFAFIGSTGGSTSFWSKCPEQFCIDGSLLLPSRELIKAYLETRS